MDEKAQVKRFVRRLVHKEAGPAVFSRSLCRNWKKYILSSLKWKQIWQVIGFEIRLDQPSWLCQLFVGETFGAAFQWVDMNTEHGIIFG